MDKKGQAFTCSLAQNREEGDLGTKRRPKGDPDPQKGPLGDPGPNWAQCYCHTNVFNSCVHHHIGTNLFSYNRGILRPIRTRCPIPDQFWHFGPVPDHVRNSGLFSDPLGVLINISWVDFPRPLKKHILGTPWKDPCKDLGPQILIVTVITLYNRFRWTGLEFLHNSVFRDTFEPQIVFHVIKCLTSCLQVFFSIVMSATLGALERGSWE